MKEVKQEPKKKGMHSIKKNNDQQIQTKKFKIKQNGGHMTSIVVWRRKRDLPLALFVARASFAASSATGSAAKLFKSF